MFRWFLFFWFIGLALLARFAGMGDWAVLALVAATATFTVILAHAGWNPDPHPGAIHGYRVRR